MSQTTTAPKQEILLPEPAVLVQAAKLSVQLDRPIQMDYYADTAQQKAFLVEDTENDKKKVLLKSRDEFTSYISKTFRAGDDYLIVTENSIYIVSSKIVKRKIQLSSLDQ
jgi:hypothetical protein